MQGTTLAPPGSVIRRYHDKTGAEFDRELERTWQALEAIKNQVKNLVRDDKLEPLEGVGILACTSAQVFGYAAFHGQPTPIDVMSAAEVWRNS